MEPGCQPAHGSLLVGGEGIFSGRWCGADGQHGLHFNNHSPAAVISNEVDLAAPDSHVAVDDGQAVALEEQGRDRLTESPNLAPAQI